MKTKFLLIASLICLFGFNTACNDSCNDSNINTKDENNLLQDENSLAGTWECIPERHPDVTFTMNIDLENNVYVIANPEDEIAFQYAIVPYMYMLCNDMKGIKIGNNIHFYYDGKDNYDELSGFEIIKLSKNTMQLKYFGIVLAYDKLVTEFLFTKINGSNQ